MYGIRLTLAVACTKWSGATHAQGPRRGLGNAVLGATRSVQTYSAIGDAIDLAVNLFDAYPPPAGTAHHRRFRR